MSEDELETLYALLNKAQSEGLLVICGTFGDRDLENIEVTDVSKTGKYVEIWHE